MLLDIKLIPKLLYQALILKCQYFYGYYIEFNDDAKKQKKIRMVLLSRFTLILRKSNSYKISTLNSPLKSGKGFQKCLSPRDLIALK